MIRADALDPLDARAPSDRRSDRVVAAAFGLAAVLRIGDSQVAFRSTPPQDVLVPGQFVYHDANIDVPPEAFTAFKTAHPSTLGAVRLVQLQADPEAGLWWLAVEDAELMSHRCTVQSCPHRRRPTQ